MPCHAAIVKKYPVLSPEDGVEGALQRMKKEEIEAAPVVDKDGKLVGLFSIQGLMKSLLPVSVAMADGINLNISLQAAPGIAKRLKKTESMTVADVMEKKITSVQPETPTWEGVNILVQKGAPLMVVERETGRLSGVITFQSALDELERLKDSEA